MILQDCSSYSFGVEKVLVFRFTPIQMYRCMYMMTEICDGVHPRAINPSSSSSPSQSVLSGSGGLHVVGIGSVLENCWQLLKDGEVHDNV